MNREAAIIEFTRTLVSIPSVLGGEKRVCEAVAAKMQELGFSGVEIDRVGNTVGVIGGANDGPTLLLDAHADTVDVLPRERWTRDPFGAEIVGNRIYGRGTSDMKGALAAMVFAAASLDRRSLCGRVTVSCSVGEESIEGAALESVVEEHRPDFVVIGEASELNLVRAGRGRAEFVLETRGQPAHAANPSQGSNAVLKMMAVIEQLKRLPMPHHPFVGEGVMCLTDIISEPFPAQSMVPFGCRATYERRLLPGESLEQVADELNQACKRGGREEVGLSLAKSVYETFTGAHLRRPKWLPAWELPENHSFVQTALRGLARAGLNPRVTSFQFCTNASYTAGTLGIPTIGFGPSSEQMAHIIDEFIEIEELVKAFDGYAGICGEVLSGNRTDS